MPPQPHGCLFQIGMIFSYRYGPTAINQNKSFKHFDGDRLQFCQRKPFLFLEHPLRLIFESAAWWQNVWWQKCLVAKMVGGGDAFSKLCHKFSHCWCWWFSCWFADFDDDSDYCGDLWWSWLFNDDHDWFLMPVCLYPCMSWKSDLPTEVCES